MVGERLKQRRTQIQAQQQQRTRPPPSSSSLGRLPAEEVNRRPMKSKASKKPADEDEAKSKKIRSSRGKRRRNRHSRSLSSSDSGSDSPPRKRSKKSTKKVVDKKSKKKKGSSTSRRRRRSPSPSPSSSSNPSSVSRSRSHSRRRRHSSISASERSVSPLPRSHSKDTRKGKERGRGRDKDQKTRRGRRSRSYSTSPASSGSSQGRSRSKSRKRGVGDTRDDATRHRIVQDYDNYHAFRNERNSIEDVDRDEEAIAVARKGIVDYEKNVLLQRRESSPSEDSKEIGEIISPKDASLADEILPVGGGSPVVEEDLELILRKKALENFRKFKEAAVMPGKTNSNGIGKEILTDSLQSSTKIAEARSGVTPSQMQGNSFGIGHSAGSPEFDDFGNGTSPSNQEMSCGERSPGVLKASDTSAPTRQQGSRMEFINPTSRLMSQDGRNGRSVMQRLGINLASSTAVNQRLGSSTGEIPVQATRRVRSVVSIPVREGLDGSESTTTLSVNPVPDESSIEVRHPPVKINILEETNGDDRKTGEASAPDSSVLSTDEGKRQAGTEDKDGSQFEKRTFSRMHDGETVQVSYKVYIPTTSPRLARRKLHR